MDRLGLQILLSEMLQDASILRQSSENASLRIHETHPGHLEACGYELHRFYNVLEKSLERLCQAFENHFEKKGDYHERLLERLQLEIPEVRPAFLPATHKTLLRELKGFRHVFRHAYDLELRQDRLLELTHHAQVICEAFPDWIRRFEATIKTQLLA
jgi:hypothetical protein